jgi:hypothetical protein
MPTVYANGGAPNYSGVPVANGSEILENIRDTLVSAGWFTVFDSIGIGNALNQFITMRLTSVVGGTQVWYKFTILDNSENVAGGLKVSIQGSSNAGFTITSSEFDLPFTQFNEDSRLWISCDEEAFAISLISFATLARGVHGGFLNRLETTDNGAYCIGYTLSDIEQTYGASGGGIFYQVGLSAFNNTAWREVAQDFQKVNFTTIMSAVATSNTGCYQGFFDRYTSCIIPYRCYSNTVTLEESRNPGFKAFNGRLNGVNEKAVLGEYFVTEGRGSTANYSVTGVLSPILYYRGNTKFCVVGMSSFPAGVSVEAIDGSRYLSVGPIGWQGMRIL